MKRLVVLLVVVFCVVTGARASEPDLAKVTALIQLEHSWQQAISSGDRHVLGNILGRNFIDTSYNGKLRTRDEILESTKGARRYDAALADLRVRLFGDTAVVTGLNTVTGPGKAWTAQLRFTDIFINRDNRWQAVGAQESLLRATGAGAGSSRQEQTGISVHVSKWTTRTPVLDACSAVWARGRSPAAGSRRLPQALGFA